MHRCGGSRASRPGYFETMGNPSGGGALDHVERDPRAAAGDRRSPRRSRASIGESPRERSASACACCSRKMPWREIVGVVGDERDDGLNQPATAIVYWPMLNESYRWRTMAYAVRSTRVGTPGFLREIEQAVWSVNPNLPLAACRRSRRFRRRSMAQTSFALVMLGIAASVALLHRRGGDLRRDCLRGRAADARDRHPHGARRADRATCAGCFSVRGSWLTAAGIALGIGVALVLTRVMSAFLFGVRPDGSDDVCSRVGGAGGGRAARDVSSGPPRRARRSHRRAASGRVKTSYNPRHGGAHESCAFLWFA